MKAGFYGGVVVDYPESTKKKKHFLVLMTGGNMPLPEALTDHDGNPKQASFISKRWDQLFVNFRRTLIQILLMCSSNFRVNFKNLKGKPPKKSRDWILEKKERRRRQGRTVREDSKFTGRPRSGRF